MNVSDESSKFLSMQFIEFLNQRQNIEKTRNFNVFKSYTLDGLKIVFDFFNENSVHKTHSPIRISVVGTNGKGSTSHYLACLFSKLGYKVGLYTSPHLVSPLERFQIVTNGKPDLPNIESVEKCFQTIFVPNRKFIEQLSYFEFLTLFTYQFFQSQKMDIEIWEAGLGGRLDATKLVEANHIVLTKIGLDHSEILGDTKESICNEKLGIINHNTNSLFAMLEEVNSLSHSIQNRPRKEEVPLFVFNTPPKESYLETNFLYAKSIIEHIFPEKKEVLNSFLFSDFTKPKGRMEVLVNSPLVVFDPSHNPDAVRTTTLEFSKSHPRFHLLVGSLPDKDLNGILEVLPEVSLETLVLWEGEGFGRFPEPKYGLRERTHRQRSTEGLVPLFQGRTPILVLGSFRLYGIVANLIQNTIKM